MTNTVKIKGQDSNGQMVEVIVYPSDILHALAEMNELEEYPLKPNHWRVKGEKGNIDSMDRVYYLSQYGFERREVKDYSPRSKFTYEFPKDHAMFNAFVDHLRDPYTDIKKAINVPRGETISFPIDSSEGYINIETGAVMICTPGDPVLKVLALTPGQREDIQMLAKSRYNQKYGISQNDH